MDDKYTIPVALLRYRHLHIQGLDLSAGIHRLMRHLKLPAESMSIASGDGQGRTRLELMVSSLKHVEIDHLDASKLIKYFPRHLETLDVSCNDFDAVHLGRLATLTRLKLLALWRVDPDFISSLCRTLEPLNDLTVFTCNFRRYLMLPERFWEVLMMKWQLSVLSLVRTTITTTLTFLRLLRVNLRALDLSLSVGVNDPGLFSLHELHETISESHLELLQISREMRPCDILEFPPRLRYFGIVRGSFRIALEITKRIPRLQVLALSDVDDDISADQVEHLKQVEYVYITHYNQEIACRQAQRLRECVDADVILTSWTSHHPLLKHYLKHELFSDEFMPHLDPPVSSSRPVSVTL